MRFFEMVHNAFICHQFSKWKWWYKTIPSRSKLSTLRQIQGALSTFEIGIGFFKNTFGCVEAESLKSWEFCCIQLVLLSFKRCKLNETIVLFFWVSNCILWSKFNAVWPIFRNMVFVILVPCSFWLCTYCPLIHIEKSHAYRNRFLV